MDARGSPSLTVPARRRAAGWHVAAAAAALVAAVVSATAPASTSAAPPGVSWTVSRQPATVPLAVATLVTVTATNTSTTSEQIGCIQIGVTSAFAIVATSITSAPPDRTWTASHLGTVVTAKAKNGGSTLRGGTDRDTVGIGVTVSGLVPGSHSWSASAYSDTGCQKPMGLTASLTVTVTVLATPTPTPAPTRTPTPTPTVRPTTPPPSPSTAPSPETTAEPGRSEEPTAPSPSPSPAGPGPRPSPTGSASPEPALPSGWTGRTPDRYVVRLEGSEPLRVDLSGSLDAGRLAIQWGVPAIALSVPGIFVIGVVLAQAFGGLIWLPLVRRWIGAFGIRRRRRDGARPPH